MTRRIPRHQDDAPPARNAWWTPRAKRLLATMGPRAVPFRELRASAERIVGEAPAVDLICSCDLRGEIIRLGGQLRALDAAPTRATLGRARRRGARGRRTRSRRDMGRLTFR